MSSLMKAGVSLVSLPPISAVRARVRSKQGVLSHVSRGNQLPQRCLLDSFPNHSSTTLSNGRRYGVIYADPPWSFRTWSSKGTGRSAISHYDCLDFSALAALPVAELAADDCVLFLWATDPLLPRAYDLIRAWGFEYKPVGFYWVKLNARPKHDADFFVGMGYWTRANPELCLLATRGKPPRQAKNVRRLVVAPRRAHSRKPDCVREQIQRLVPGPYVELFARETKEGWDCWGNQVGLFDHGAVRTRRQPSRLLGAPEADPGSRIKEAYVTKER
jgi:N6-adenosine-specific RNA methylase IME4